MMNLSNKHLSYLLGLIPLLALHNASLLAGAQVDNTNPNYPKLHEYGRIEWHGDTARLIAGGSRPLHFAALTLTSCLGISVSAEDPHYMWPSDLLDVTTPQWAANHRDRHAYATKPGRVEVSFQVDHNGQPVNSTKLLNEAAEQVNQQQPWHFRLQQDVRQDHSFFTFVPTVTHNKSGQLEEIDSWLDQRMTIPPTTAHIFEIADTLAKNLTSKSGYHFSCCQMYVAGVPWGGRTIHYEASEQTSRLILEDLMIAAGGPTTSYVQVCEPMDKRFCFIDVRATENRVPITAPQSGVCAADGYDPE